MSMKLAINMVMTVALKSFQDTAKKRDKSNSGAVMAEWFFWKELAKIAKNKEEVCRANVIKEEIIKDPTTITDAGTHDLGETPGFVCTVKVTEKVQEFDVNVLAATLLKSHKVPIPATLKAYSAAKQPTGNPRRTVEVIER